MRMRLRWWVAVMGALLCVGRSVHASSCVWQGDSGSWTDAAHWSCGHPPSCGALGGPGPFADDCTLDGTSFTLDGQTITTGGVAVCCNNWNSSAVTHNPTLNMGFQSAIELSGSFTTIGPSGMTYISSLSNGHAIIEASGSAGGIFHTAGQQFFQVGVDAALTGAGTWQLDDPVTTADDGAVFCVAAGSTLNLGAQDVNAGGIFAFSGGNLTTDGSVFNVSTVEFDAGSTLSLGTSVFQLQLTGTSPYITFENGTGQLVQDVRIAADAPAVFGQTLGVGSAIGSLLVRSGVHLTLAAGTTWTVTTLIDQATLLAPVILDSDTTDSPATLTIPGGPQAVNFWTVQDNICTNGCIDTDGIDNGNNTNWSFIMSITPTETPTESPTETPTETPTVMPTGVPIGPNDCCGCAFGGCQPGPLTCEFPCQAFLNSSCTEDGCAAHTPTPTPDSFDRNGCCDSDAGCTCAKPVAHVCLTPGSTVVPNAICPACTPTPTFMPPPS